MSRLRVAEVGIRGKGGQHMEILSGFEEVELVAVCDTVPEILESVGDKFGISCRYSSVDQLLDSEELDAVFIATPPEFNAPVALPCLEHGVNTFLEKPPGMTAAEAKGLVVAAEKSGAKGMVGLNRRFHPMLNQALEMVEERGPVIQLVGEFHKPMSVLAKMSRFAPEVMDNWLVANDIHVVDMVRRMAGAEVREVHSFARRAVSEYRDVHAALVVFENDCVASYSFNYTTAQRLERYEIHGNNVSAYLEGVREGFVLRGDERIELPFPETSGTEEEIRYFIDCLLEDRPVAAPAPTLEEGFKSVQLVEAIRAGLTE